MAELKPKKRKKVGASRAENTENKEVFRKNLKKLIEANYEYDYEFADAIGVKRSRLSTTLIGRTDPTLSFVYKISDSFPELNLNWLLRGTGTMLVQTRAIKRK